MTMSRYQKLYRQRILGEIQKNGEWVMDLNNRPPDYVLQLLDKMENEGILHSEQLPKSGCYKYTASK